MDWSVNYPAVLVTAVVIFLLGGLWYSPVLFAKKWVALQGKSAEEMSGGAKPSLYVQVFICGLLIAWVMGLITRHMPLPSVAHGVLAGALLWLGFAGPTSFGTALFSFKPKALWAIDSGFNLVSFLIAGAILTVWR
jgi:hypothetical protein